MERTALVFAAGLGTRLKPLTDSMPKALVPYRGTPLLESLLRKLKASGFTRVVINVHHFADMIEDFVRTHGGFGLEVRFSDERDLLRETGGGIRHAAPLLQEDPCFMVHNVDIVSNLDLTEFHDSFRPGELARLLVSKRDTARYFVFDGDMRLVGWTNIQSGAVKSPYPEVLECGSEGLRRSDRYRLLAFGGIHLISSRIFPLMTEWPDRFSIVDFYLSMADKERIIGVEAAPDCNLVDVGKLDQLKRE